MTFVLTGVKYQWDIIEICPVTVLKRFPETL